MAQTSRGEHPGESKEIMTIHDVARELGVSASTVSRAISGKGRIGEATRQRVLAFINDNQFHPNAAAKSLAQSRTFNLAIVMPEVKDLVDMPFFHTCMHGAEEVAQSNDYDLLVVTTDWSNLHPLERMVGNRKVDGIILTRTYENDPFVAYLKEARMPFVAVGRCYDPKVLQVDHDNAGACRELVTILFGRGLDRIAYLGGSMDQMVNLDRYMGYCQAYEAYRRKPDEEIIYKTLQNTAQIASAVDEILRKKVDCILCQDDFICDGVVRHLGERGVKIPDQIRIASCHHSRMLDNYPITITSLKFDTMEIGRKACQVLLDEIEGRKPKRLTMLDYEISLKESTK